MKVLRCVFPCLFEVFYRVLCMDTCDIWLQHEKTNVTYGTSTPLEGAQSTFQCLLTCSASEGCESVNVNQDNFQCEFSTYHPEIEDGISVNQRPGWTVYYREIRNCKDRMDAGDTTTGFKTIKLDGINPARVLCIMEEDGGGWTVIQKRESASDFYKNWQQYRNGFGDDTNFWLGLENIHRLTAQGNYELRIDMMRTNNERAAAKYQTFSVGNEAMLYKLTLGNYSFDPDFKNPKDSFLYQNDMKFTTYDNDNDESYANCADLRMGAYWYQSCGENNLNGVYGSTAWREGIFWYSWTGPLESLKYTRMMIRPN